MADNIVRIDTAKVRQAGETIIHEGTQMHNALQRIQELVKGTEKCLQSDGGDAARTNFNTSATKFDAFKTFVHDYGEFLKNYSDTHKGVDQQVQNYAEDIPVL